MSAAVAPLPQSKEARQSAALGRNIDGAYQCGCRGNLAEIECNRERNERCVKGTKTCSLYCFRMSRPPATSK
jgi:hypothetical protein